MFLYEIINQKARILACRSFDTIAVIPERINRYPVTELAPYAFSEGGSGDTEGLWFVGEDEIEKQPDRVPYLRCGRLTEIYLPESIETIGKYGFYNCSDLRTLHCSSTIADLGSGVFTGCHKLFQIEIQLMEGRRSCFQELISELRQKLEVVCHIVSPGQRETAKLIFPEYYEEAVENTPARILETHMHGCGHRYRYCFSQTHFQLKEYDALFPHIKVQEAEKLVVELVIGRLQFPYQLSEEAKLEYQGYLKEHQICAARYILEAEEGKGLDWLLSLAASGEKEIAGMIQIASELGSTAALGYLMNYRHSRFQKTRKIFEL